MHNVFLIFSSRRLFVMLLLGFSSGLPLALSGATLKAWMKSAGIPISEIGLYSLVGLPYTVKFLWAPLLDRYVPPFLDRRRGWLAVFQCGLIVSLLLLGRNDPASNPGVTAMIALVVAFFSASQDIVFDGYRTEVLSPDERGVGAAITILGYRLAMLTSGALALILVESLSWSAVYALMAACSGVGLLGTALAEPTPQESIPPRTLREAVVEPFRDFFSKQGAREILAFIILYKLGDVVALSLSNPFLLDLGFTTADIGYISKGAGLAATIIGALVGGALIPRLGMERALLIFGALQGGTLLNFAWLSSVGRSYPLLTWAIISEQFCIGLGTAASVAFLMSLCSRRFSATQYALLTSFSALSGTYASSIAGYLVEWLGWTHFFILCTVLALPGLLLVKVRYRTWMPS